MNQNQCWTKKMYKPATGLVPKNAVSEWGLVIRISKGLWEPGKKMKPGGKMEMGCMK